MRQDAAPPLSYGILGPLELRRGDRRLALGGPRQTALLAYLLMNANRAVPSDELADALWDDTTAGPGAKRLQMAVTRLRRVVDGDGDASALRTVSGGYVLVVEPGALDADVFARRVRDAEQALESGDPARVVELLGAALGLWRGAPLADVGYMEFAQVEIRRLEELRLHALEVRIEADLQLGRQAAVAGELEALVSEHPSRERPVAQLMLALYRCGRQAEALDVYRRTREHLSGELGLEPGLELKELQARILEQSASLELTAGALDAVAAGPVPLPALVARLGRQPLLGRDDELRRIESCWEETLRTRSHRVLLIGGEPGVGKTSLATHFACRVSEQEATVLYGRADAEALVSYQPFVDALRHLAQHAPPALLEAATEDLAELSRIVPEIRRRLPDLPPPLEHSTGDDRYRLYSSIAALLGEVAQRTPLVLILDDLHWADRSTLRLVCHLARYSDPAPLLIVGTYRDTELRTAPELEDVLVDLRREHLDERMTLGGLGESAVRELVIGATRSAAESLGAMLHEETRGNAFFVVEMLRHLTDSAAFLRGAPDRGAARLLAEAGVPEGITQVIERRLSGLGEGAREALTAASVLGQEFDPRLLAAVTDSAPQDVAASLAEALEASVVAQVAGAQRRLEFSHALVRETLYRGLPAPRRSELHRRAGAALERLGAGDAGGAAQLAHHFFAAGGRVEVQRAVGYSVAAAEQATTRLAHDEAAAHYARAVEHAGPDDAKRCDLLLALGEARWCCGELGSAREACREAAGAARRLGDAERLARAALAHAGPLRFEPAARREQPLVALLEDARRALGAAPSPLRARVTARLAAVLLSGGEEERKHALAREAVAIARGLDDDPALADVLATALFATRGPDNLDERLATGRELARLADEIGEGRLQAVTRGGLVDDLLELGDIEASDRELALFERLAEALGERYRRWLVALAKTRRALIEGRLDDCEAMAQHAVTLGLGDTDESAFHAFAAHILFLRREQGRLAELVEGVEFTVREYPEVPAWRCGLAHVYMELGRTVDARRELDELGTDGFADLPRDAWWLVAVAVLAEVAAGVEAVEHADRLYEVMSPFGGRCVVATIMCGGSVARGLGVLATALSRYELAARHFEDALAVNAAIRSPLWVARTQLDLARMLLLRGAGDDRARARALIEQAAAAGAAHRLPAIEALAGDLQRSVASV